MSLPSSRIRPWSGVSKPASIRNSVVLPQPLGPSRAKNSPALISSDKPIHRAEAAEFFSTTASMRNKGISAAPASRFWFRKFLSHLPRQPIRGCTLAADRHRLNRDTARSHNIIRRTSTIRWFHGAMEFTLICRERKMNRDRYDLPLTTVSDRAAVLYRDGADRILSAWNGAGDAFDAAIVERSSLRARSHRASPRPSAQHGIYRGTGQGQRGRASWLLPATRQRTPAHRDHGRGHRGTTGSGFDRRRAASRRVSSRCTRPFALARLPSASMHFPAARTTIRRGSRSASATRSNMARTGGS